MIRFHNPLQAYMQNLCKQACNSLPLSKQDRDSGERLKLQTETRLDVRMIYGTQVTGMTQHVYCD